MRDDDWVFVNPDSPGGRLVRRSRDAVMSLFSRPLLALAAACALGAALLIFGSIVLWVDPWLGDWRIFALSVGSSFGPSATLVLLAAALLLLIGRSSGPSDLGGRLFPAVLALAGTAGAAANLIALAAAVSLWGPGGLGGAAEFGGRAGLVLGYLSLVVLAGLVTSLGLTLSWQAAASHGAD